MRKLTITTLALGLILALTIPAQASEKRESNNAAAAVVCSLFAGTPTVSGALVAGYGAISCTGSPNFVKVFVQLSHKGAFKGTANTQTGVNFAGTYDYAVDVTPLTGDLWHTWVWGYAYKNGVKVWSQDKPGKRSNLCKTVFELPTPLGHFGTTITLLPTCGSHPLVVPVGAE